MDADYELEYLRAERVRLNKGLMTSVQVILWGAIVIVFCWIYHIAELKEEHTRQLNQARREPREYPTMREREILRDNQYLYKGK